MRSEHLKSLSLSAVVLVLLLAAGVFLSRHKLLWIDECFTEHVSVGKPSYIDILTLHIPDGNKCPLYYILQKAIEDVSGFKYPIRQAQNSFDVTDVHSQIMARIPANLYMSLALALLFYYFTRFYSLWAGMYSLAAGLVLPMVWSYWVEARPYSLWFLLTTGQLLCYCAMFQKPSIKTNKFITLSHLLLILTTPGSIFQVTIISFLLLLQNKFKKRELLLAWCLPAGIFLAYYFLIPVYKFKTLDLLSCLFEAAPPERLALYLVYAMTAWLMRKNKVSSNAFFLPVFLLFLISACIVLLMNLFTRQYQFEFHNRYLIYLASADVIMFTMVGIDLWRWAGVNVWLRLNVFIVLAGLVITRGLITYRDILATGLYLHSPGSI